MERLQHELDGKAIEIEEKDEIIQSQKKEI